MGLESQQVQETATRLDLLVKERDGLRNGIEEHRQLARALAQRQRGCEQEISQLEVKRTEATVRLESVAARILEEYQIDLAEAFGNYQRPEDLDWDGLRSRLEDAEQRLAALGPVNLAAIDELDEVKARELFLETQHQDLSRAAGKLTGIIEDINQVSRKLFEGTYRTVRKNFQELFRKLFGGGACRPRAGEGRRARAIRSSMLEAGLEIMAQPPGKNPKIITQLSRRREGPDRDRTALRRLSDQAQPLLHPG